MKVFFITILSLLTTVASAQNIEYIDPEFDPCTRVQGMVILNKDNYPYWVAQPGDIEDLLQCYAIMKNYMLVASESDLQQVLSNLGGRVRVFDEDQDFQEFLNQQQGFQPQITPSVPEPQQPQGFKTINPYVQSEIVNGLWVK